MQLATLRFLSSVTTKLCKATKGVKIFYFSKVSEVSRTYKFSKWPKIA